MTTISPATASEWKPIIFRFRFAVYAQFPAIREHLDTAYSYEILDPNNLFVDKESRTTLQASAIAVLRNIIVESIEPEATTTVTKKHGLILSSVIWVCLLRMAHSCVLRYISLRRSIMLWH